MVSSYKEALTAHKKAAKLPAPDRGMSGKKKRKKKKPYKVVFDWLPAHPLYKIKKARGRTEKAISGRYATIKIAEQACEDMNRKYKGTIKFWVESDDDTVEGKQ